MDDDMKTDEDDLTALCICPDCPSYADCDELAFCLEKSEISNCITAEVGCICTGCPVRGKMQYTRDYFCTRGNEKDQLTISEGVFHDPGSVPDVIIAKDEENLRGGG